MARDKLDAMSQNRPGFRPSNVEEEIIKVGNEIIKVGNDIDKVENEIKEVEDKREKESDPEEKAFLRKEKEQLRKKEEQLRKEKEQLRKEKEQLRSKEEQLRTKEEQLRQESRLTLESFSKVYVALTSPPHTHTLSRPLSLEQTAQLFSLDSVRSLVSSFCLEPLLSAQLKSKEA